MSEATSPVNKKERGLDLPDLVCLHAEWNERLYHCVKGRVQFRRKNPETEHLESKGTLACGT